MRWPDRTPKPCHTQRSAAQRALPGGRQADPRDRPVSAGRIHRRDGAPRHAEAAGERLGQTVLIDNKPGANGIIGADALAEVAAATATPSRW